MPVVPIVTTAHPDVKFPGKLIVMNVGNNAIKVSGSIIKLFKIATLYIEEIRICTRHVLEPSDPRRFFLRTIHINYGATMIFGSSHFFRHGNFDVTAIIKSFHFCILHVFNTS